MSTTRLTERVMHLEKTVDTLHAARLAMDEALSGLDASARAAIKENPNPEPQDSDDVAYAKACTRFFAVLSVPEPFVSSGGIMGIRI